MPIVSKRAAFEAAPSRGIRESLGVVPPAADFGA